MLKIRLKRLGRKSRPFYKILLAGNLTGRNGKCAAELGFYDPIAKRFGLDRKELLKHLENGAYPTAAVRHLLLNISKHNPQRAVDISPFTRK